MLVSFLTYSILIDPQKRQHCNFQWLSNLYEVTKWGRLEPKMFVSRVMENAARLDLGVEGSKKRLWKRKNLRWKDPINQIRRYFFPHLLILTANNLCYCLDISHVNVLLSKQMEASWVWHHLCQVAETQSTITAHLLQASPRARDEEYE